MAKEKETIEFSANGKTTGPIPMDQFEKSVKNAKASIVSPTTVDLLDTLRSKQDLINFHVERIITHAISNPDEKAGKMTIQINASHDKGFVIIIAKIKSVLPNESEDLFPLAKISLDDGQLSLFN